MTNEEQWRAWIISHAAIIKTFRKQSQDPDPRAIKALEPLINEICKLPFKDRLQIQGKGRTMETEASIQYQALISAMVDCYLRSNNPKDTK